MNTQRGFFGAIAGVVVMVAFVLGALYLLLGKAPISIQPPAQQATTTPSEPLAPAPTTTPAVVVDPDSTATTTYKGMVEAHFEGTEQISFQFSYVPSQITLTPSDKGVTLVTRGATSTVATSSIAISYEGGRGYEPKDYWTEIAKKDCAGCTSTKPIVTFSGTTTSVTYQNAKKVVQISTNPFNNNWLLIFTISKPFGKVNLVLSSFSVTSAN